MDFERFNEIVTFQRGNTVNEIRCIDVRIFNDTVEEENEVFFVLIFIGTSNSQGTIDSERQKKTVTIVDGEYPRY